MGIAADTRERHDTLHEIDSYEKLWPINDVCETVDNLWNRKIR